MSRIHIQTGKLPGNQQKALRLVAEIISVIFHPVFFPLVMAVMLYELNPASFVGLQPRQVGLLLIGIGITAVFFPLFSILLMKPLGFISSYKMPTARERTIPLLAAMIFYFWVSHVFNSLPTKNFAVTPPIILKVMLLGNFWGLILVFLANIFTKISMHTATAGGMVGVVIVLMIINPVNMLIPLFVSLVLAGIIGTARLILGAHERGDIWLGYIIGILVQLAAYFYLR